MANYHESGSICKANKIPCPLGADSHIEANSQEEFQSALESKMKNEMLSSVSKTSKNDYSKSIPNGTILISYDGMDSVNMQKYGTSASVTVNETTKRGTTKIDVNVYDGGDFKPEALLDSVTETLHEKGFRGNVEFKINSKYNQNEIKCYDPEDEESDPSDGGKYGIEYGHWGLYANVKVE